MKKAIDLLERFQLMTKLIVEEKTGKPEEFARRLGISRSTMYEMLEELRFHDADIRFSRSKNSFVFINEMDIDIHFSIKPLTCNEKKNISGGFLSWHIHIGVYFPTK